MIKVTYEIVCWPDIQYLMEKEGFRENAFLVNDEKGMEEFGSSAYFVKSDWLKKHTKSDWLKKHTEPKTKYVDLGLPSGTKWATCNVGAKTPKGYGDYLTYDEAVTLKDIKVPTIEQWRELQEKCEWEWDGEGCIITGKNGNSIFLPAAGYLFYGELKDAGSDGFYWSSSHDTGSLQFGMQLTFDSSEVDSKYSSHCYYGQSVRPVSK